MEYGIQRRHIYLVPAEPEDLDYLFDAFLSREVWEMFGFEGPAKALMKERHAEGNLIVAIIKLVEGRRRIGFGVCYPPPLFMRQWEYGLVIPEPKDRDGFSAIAASDAMTHYLFDHLQLEVAFWRIRADNGPSNAIARRMGYRPFGVWRVGDHRFKFYRMTPDLWAARRERLFRGEERHPCGLGAPFLTLTERPYAPEPLTSSGPTGEPSREA